MAMGHVYRTTDAALGLDPPKRINLPFQDPAVRELFDIIKKVRADWAFADDGGQQAPLNMDPLDEPVEDVNDQDYEDDSSTKLVRSGAKNELGSASRSNSNASLETLSPPNALLKGMGIGVEMTPDEEKELHAVLKAINALELESSIKS